MSVRDEQTGPTHDVLQQILTRVTALQNEGHAPAEKIPLIDPTANVKELFLAQKERNDDLRAAESRRNDDLRFQEEKCREKLDYERQQHQRELSEAEAKRIDSSALAESRRINALIEAGVNAVTLASQRAELTAKALADAVAASADALRSQVAAAAAAAMTTTEAMRANLDARVQRLEQQGYIGGGRSEEANAAKAQSQWATVVAISIVFGAFQILGHFWK
jgi:23S rRNA pseudoU1915 N3-methylase RlmH